MAHTNFVDTGMDGGQASHRIVLAGGWPRDRRVFYSRNLSRAFVTECHHSVARNIHRRTDGVAKGKEG